MILVRNNYEENFQNIGILLNYLTYRYPLHELRFLDGDGLFG